MERIRRPVRPSLHGPCVAYRGRLWLLISDSIDIAGDSFHSDAATITAQDQDRTTDASQQNVITASVSDRLLVVAGPGTGKTDVAARRLAYLIQSSVSAGRILVLSFSRSAVRTLTRRLQSKKNQDQGTLEELRHLSIRTFDAWAFRMLRLVGHSPAKLLANGHDDNIALLTDLLEGPSRDELRPLIGRKAHIIVDEFQDLPGIRGRMVLALLDLIAPPGEQAAGFTVLGDPAQAIYTFAARRDVDPGGIVDYWDVLRKRYGNTLKEAALEHNHRSTPTIATFAGGLRAIIEGKLPKAKKLELIRERLHSLPMFGGDFGPAWCPADNRTAILTRTNAEAIRVAQRLAGDANEPPGLTLQLRTSGRIQPPPAWIGALLGPAKAPTMSRTQFERIHSHWSSRLDTAAADAIGLPDADSAWKRLAVASGADFDDLSIELPALRERLDWPDAFPDDEGVRDNGVVITTVHQSKGLEFNSVVLLEPREDRGDRDRYPDEEMLVDFVAVTRAARVLQQLPANSIHAPPRRRSFPESRERRCYWRNGWVNLEAGIPGDIEPESFVDPNLHGSAEEVEKLQQFLLEQAGRLVGHKVVLKKVAVAAHQSVYDVHLQESGGAERTLGRAGQQLTIDLLHLLWNRGYSLPSRVMNLRISAVRTLTSHGDDDTLIAPAYQASRLWLGVELAGTADFRPLKRGHRK